MMSRYYVRVGLHMYLAHSRKGEIIISSSWNGKGGEHIAFLSVTRWDPGQVKRDYLGNRYKCPEL